MVHDLFDSLPPRLAQLIVCELDTNTREHIALHAAPHRLGVDEHPVHVEHARPDHAAPA